MTGLRLGVHSLRIQTGKYENAVSIPVEERKCLVRKEFTEDEQRLLLYSKYETIILLGVIIG